MVADYADKTGLRLSQPSAPTKRKLTELLPDIATVSNPLDYTTPLWGNTELMPDIFKTLVADGFDAAVIIQDYPPPHIHDDNSLYRNDGLSFMKACNQLGIPGAVCSDLPENIDAETREILIEGKITPLQGFDAGIDSLANACRYGSNRNRLLVNAESSPFKTIPAPELNNNAVVIDEYTGKLRLLDHGITIPTGVQIKHGDNPRALEKCVFPVIAKAISADLPHKSEAGALKPDLRDIRAVSNAMIEIQKSVRDNAPEARIDGFLVESMVENVIAELLVGINTDPQFGQNHGHCKRWCSGRIVTGFGNFDFANECRPGNPGIAIAARIQIASRLQGQAAGEPGAIGEHDFIAGCLCRD